MTLELQHTDFPDGQRHRDTQEKLAVGGTTSGEATGAAHNQCGDASPDQSPTQGHSTPGPQRWTALGGHTLPAGHQLGDTQEPAASGDHSSLGGQNGDDYQLMIALEGTKSSAGSANDGTLPRNSLRSLLDPLLILASVTLDDLESQRIAQENRYRSLTQSGTSENGLEWGYGLDDRDPQVAAMGAIVDQMKAMEHTANP